VTSLLSHNVKRSDLQGSHVAAVLIADDHALIRSSLKRLLEAEPSIESVSEASSGRETMELLKTQPWDLLILDINLPDRSGVDVLKYAHDTYPDVHVLILSGFSERQYGVNMLRAGAMGYVNKEAEPEELLAAVKSVLRGRLHVSDALAEILAQDAATPKGQSLHSSLSEREFQVFRRLAAGLTVSAIAEELKISVKTVSTYRSRLLQKMHFESNADLTAYALRQGLLND
jgi:two-component system invasion response regulator UvrY